MEKKKSKVYYWWIIGFFKLKRQKIDFSKIWVGFILPNNKHLQFLPSMQSIFFFKLLSGRRDE